MADIHDDPLREAASAAVGIASELANVVMATQSLQLRLIGLKPDKDAPLEELAEEAAELSELSNPQLRAQAQANARFAWQPALNDEWLADATPIEAAKAWAAAVPFADAEPSAALAVARTEIRLNEIHPEAMAEYRQLRSQGMSPTDAMLECAELFDTPSMAARATPDAAVGLASSHQSARTSLTHDMGLEHSAHLGLDHPISLGLHDQATAKSSLFDEDSAEADDSLIDEVPAASAESVLHDDLDLRTSAGATAEPATAQATVGAEGPDLTPRASAEPSATEIAMRTFPDAHQAVERTAEIQHVARPQKRKALSKVLKRGR